MYRPSAKVLLCGTLLLILGGVIMTLAQNQATAEQSYGEPDLPPWYYLGLVITLAGAICSIVGSYRLATNVDLTAEERATYATVADREALPDRVPLTAEDSRARIKEIRARQDGLPDRVPLTAEESRARIEEIRARQDGHAPPPEPEPEPGVPSFWHK